MLTKTSFIRKFKKVFSVLIFIMAFVTAFSFAFTAEELGVLGDLGIESDADLNVAAAWDGSEKGGSATGQTPIAVYFNTGTASVNIAPATVAGGFRFSWATSMTDTTINPGTTGFNVSSGTHSGDDWYVIDYIFEIPASNVQLRSLIASGLVSATATVTLGGSGNHTRGSYFESSSSAYGTGARNGDAIIKAHNKANGTHNLTIDAASLTGRYYFRWTFYGYYEGGFLHGFGNADGTNLSITFAMTNDTTNPTVSPESEYDGGWLTANSWTNLSTTTRTVGIRANDLGMVRTIFYAKTTTANAPAKGDSSYVQVSAATGSVYQSQTFTTPQVQEMPLDREYFYYHFYAMDLKGNTSAITTKTLFDFKVDPYARNLTINIKTNGISTGTVGYIDRTINLSATVTSPPVIDDLPWTKYPITFTLTSSDYIPGGSGLNRYVDGTGSTVVNGVKTVSPGDSGIVNGNNNIEFGVVTTAGTTSAMQQIIMRFDTSTPNIVNPSSGVTGTKSDGTTPILSATWYNFETVLVHVTGSTTTTLGPSGIKYQWRIGSGEWQYSTTTINNAGQPVSDQWATGPNIRSDFEVKINDDGTSDGIFSQWIYVRAINMFDVSSNQEYRFRVCLDRMTPQVTNVIHTATVAGGAGEERELINPVESTDPATGLPVYTYSAADIAWTADSISFGFVFRDGNFAASEFGPAGMNCSGFVKSASLYFNTTGIGASYTSIGGNLTYTTIVSSDISTYDSNYYQGGTYRNTVTREQYAGQTTWYFKIVDVAGNGLFIVITTKCDNITPTFTISAQRADLSPYTTLPASAPWYNNTITFTINGGNLPLSGSTYYFYASTSLQGSYPAVSGFKPIATGQTFPGVAEFVSIVPDSSGNTKITFTLPTANEGEFYFFFQRRSGAYEKTSAGNRALCYSSDQTQHAVRIDKTAPEVVSADDSNNYISTNSWTTGIYENMQVTMREPSGAGSGLLRVYARIYNNDTELTGPYASLFDRTFVSGDGVYRTTLGTTTFSGSSYTLNLSAYSSSTNKIRFWVVDVAGNTSLAKEYILKVDNINPTFNVQLVQGTPANWQESTGMRNWSAEGYKLRFTVTSTIVSNVNIGYQINSSSAGGFIPFDSNNTTLYNNEEGTYFAEMLFNPTDSGSIFYASYNAQRYFQGIVYFRIASETVTNPTVRSFTFKIDQKVPVVSCAILTEPSEWGWYGAQNIQLRVGLSDTQSGYSENTFQIYYRQGATFSGIDIHNTGGFWNGYTELPTGTKLFVLETVSGDTSYYIVTIPVSAFGNVAGNPTYGTRYKFNSGEITFYISCIDAVGNATGNSLSEINPVTTGPMNVDATSPILAAVPGSTGAGTGVYVSHVGASGVTTGALAAIWTSGTITFDLDASSLDVGDFPVSGIAAWQYSTSIINNDNIMSSPIYWSAWTTLSTSADGALFEPTESGNDINARVYRLRVVTKSGKVGEVISGLNTVCWVLCYDPNRVVGYEYASLRNISATATDQRVVSKYPAATQNEFNDKNYTGDPNGPEAVVLASLISGSEKLEDGRKAYSVGSVVTFTVRLNNIPKGYYFGGVVRDGQTSSVISTADAGGVPMHYMSNGEWASGSNSFIITHTVTSDRLSDGSYYGFVVIINKVPMAESFEVKTKASQTYSVEMLDKRINPDSLIKDDDTAHISEIVRMYTSYQSATLEAPTQNFNPPQNNLFYYTASYWSCGGEEKPVSSSTPLSGAPQGTDPSLAGYYWIRIRVYLCLKIGSGYQYVEVTPDTAGKAHYIQMIIKDFVLQQTNFVMQITYGETIPTGTLKVENAVDEGPGVPAGTWPSMATPNGGYNYKIYDEQKQYTVPVSGSPQAFRGEFDTNDDGIIDEYMFFGGQFTFQDSAAFSITNWNAGYFQNVGTYTNVRIDFTRWRDFDNKEVLASETVVKFITLVIVKATPTVSRAVNASPVGHLQPITSALFNAPFDGENPDGYLFINNLIREGSVTSKNINGELSWTLSTPVTASGDKVRGWLFTPYDTTNYNTVVGQIDFGTEGRFIKLDPIAQSVPAGALTYGQPVESMVMTGGKTLTNLAPVIDYSIVNPYRADVTVTGTFTWNVESQGVYLAAGVRTAYVDFIPYDPVDPTMANAYNTVTRIPVTVTVAKATPVINQTDIIPFKISPFKELYTGGNKNYEAVLSYGQQYLDLTSSWQAYFGYTASNPYNPSWSATFTLSGGVGVYNYGAGGAHSGLQADGWSFTTGATDTPAASDNATGKTIVFTPADTANYNPCQISFRVKVDRAVPVITASVSDTAVYGARYGQIPLSLSAQNPYNGAQVALNPSGSNWQKTNDFIPSVANILDARAVIENNSSLDYGVIYSSAQLTAAGVTAEQLNRLLFIAYKLTPVESLLASYIQVNNTGSGAAEVKYYLFLDLKLNRAYPYFYTQGTAGKRYYADFLSASEIYFGQPLSLSGLNASNSTAYNQLTGEYVTGVFSWLSPSDVPQQASYTDGTNNISTAHTRYRVVFTPTSYDFGNPERNNYYIVDRESGGTGEYLYAPVIVRRAELLVTIDSIATITYGQNLNSVALTLTAKRLVVATVDDINNSLSRELYMLVDSSKYYRWYLITDGSAEGIRGEGASAAYFGTAANLGRVMRADSERGAVSGVFKQRIVGASTENINPAAFRPDAGDTATKYVIGFTLNNAISQINYNTPIDMVTTLNVEKAALTIFNVSVSELNYGQRLNQATFTFSLENGNWREDPVNSNPGAILIGWKDAAEGNKMPTVAQSGGEYYYAVLSVQNFGGAIKASNYKILTGDEGLASEPGYALNNALRLTVTVKKANVSFSALSATAVTYDALLSSCTLEGTATNFFNVALTNLAGNFAWETPATRLNYIGSGTAHSFVWTPFDTINYNVCKGTFAPTVGKAQLTTSYTGNITITYGDAVGNNKLGALTSFVLRNPNNEATMFHPTVAQWAEDSATLLGGQIHVGNTTRFAVSLGISAANAEFYTLPVFTSDSASPKQGNILVGITVLPYTPKFANATQTHPGFANPLQIAAGYNLEGGYTITGAVNGFGSEVLSDGVMFRHGNFVLAPAPSGGYADITSTPAYTSFNGAYAGFYSVKFVPSNPDYKECYGFVEVKLASPAETPSLSALETGLSITYGKILSDSSMLISDIFNLSVASGLGTFSWATDDDGTMGGKVLRERELPLNAGATAYEYYVYWTPKAENANSYNRVKTLLRVYVAKAMATVSIVYNGSYATTGAVITYGQQLGEINLEGAGGIIDISNSTETNQGLEVQGFYRWRNSTDRPVVNASGEVAVEYGWIEFVPSDTLNYVITPCNIKATVLKANAVVTRSASAIIYGQTLSQSTITVTAARNPYASALAVLFNAPQWTNGQSVGGSAISPANFRPEANWSGVEFIDGRIKNYKMTFTPVDTLNYNTIQLDVEIKVNKAAVSVVGAGLADGKNGLQYGMTLEMAGPGEGNQNVLLFSSNMKAFNSYIGADAFVTGTFAWLQPGSYRPTSINGSETLYVKWTPSDENDAYGNKISDNYTVVDQAASITIAVNKATPVVSISSFTNSKNTNFNYLFYGQQLSEATVIAGGYIAKNPWNSEWNVEGTFMWSDGTLVLPVAAAGTSSYNIVFNAAQDHYYNARTINQPSPEVQKCNSYTFGDTVTKTITYGQFLSAVNFEGIVATNAYNSSLTATGVFAWEQPNVVLNANDAAYAPVFTFTPSAESTANYTAFSNGNSGAKKTILVQVNKANVQKVGSFSAANAIFYGMKLSDTPIINAHNQHVVGGEIRTDIAGVYSWKNPNQVPTVADSNNTGFRVVWTPDASVAQNYNVMDADTWTATVVVNKANILVNTANATEIPKAAIELFYGQPLSQTAIVYKFYNAQLYTMLSRTEEITSMVQSVTWANPSLVSPVAASASFAISIRMTDAAKNNFTSDVYTQYLDTNGNPVDAVASVTIKKAHVNMPGINSAHAINYGQTLSEAGLINNIGGRNPYNATMTVEGTANYVNGSNIENVKPGGVETQVRFVPSGAEAANYEETVIQVIVVINKTKPVVVVPLLTATEITYGQTMAEISLTKSEELAVYNPYAAAASPKRVVTGSFVWTLASYVPHVNESNQRFFTFSFVPAETGNYETASTDNEGRLLQRQVKVNPKTVTIKPQDTTIAESTPLTTFYATDAIIGDDGKIVNVESLVRTLIFEGLVNNDGANVFDYSNLTIRTERADGSGSGSYNTGVKAGDSTNSVYFYIFVDGITSSSGDYNITFSSAFLYVHKKGSIALAGSKPTGGNMVKIALPTDADFQNLVGTQSGIYKVGYYDELGNLVTLAARLENGELVFASAGNYDYFVIGAAGLEELYDYSTALIIVGSVLAAAAAAGLIYYIVTAKRKKELVPSVVEEENLTEIIEEQ